MPFIREFNTLLYDSNNNVIYIDSNNGITFSLYDNSLNLISRKQIYKGISSFVTCHFDIDSDDIIYGLLKSETNELQYVTIANKYCIKNNILKYNPYENTIKFPYIKKTHDYISLFYYLIVRNTPHTCSLVHKYNNKGIWNEYIIDTINYDVLSNFRIINTPSHVIAFYFKLCDSHEELFMRCFNLSENIWSLPYQLTFSGNPKMYLSVIKDNNDCYHITYSENILGQYHCCYINGYTDFKKFTRSISKTFKECIACTFPTIIYYNDKLYIQWTEYNVLNSVKSSDNGKTWSRIDIDPASVNNNFSCCRFGANMNNNNIIYSFFNQKGFINVLGIR